MARPSTFTPTSTQKVSTFPVDFLIKLNHKSSLKSVQSVCHVDQKGTALCAAALPQPECCVPPLTAAQALITQLIKTICTSAHSS